MKDEMSIFLIYSKVENYYCDALPKTLNIMRRVALEDFGEEKYFIFRYVPEEKYFVNVDDEDDIRFIDERQEFADELQSTLDEQN